MALDGKDGYWRGYPQSLLSNGSKATQRNSCQEQGQDQQAWSQPQAGYQGNSQQGFDQQVPRSQQIPYSQQPSYSQAYSPGKSHVVAGLLAIFLGGLGIHKFYLGYNTTGFIMLAVTVLGSFFTFGLAGSVMIVIGVVEGVIYLATGQQTFDITYVYKKKEWF